jgi:hypothetical protein
VSDFPTAAVQDLRGLVRALHLARRRAGASAHEIEKLERIGRALTDALKEAGLSAPGSLRYEEAIAMAELASEQLGDLVAIADPAQPMIKAAQDRVFGATLAKRG